MGLYFSFTSRNKYHQKITMEARKSDLVQVKNIRTNRYIKIDRSIGKIVAHKRTEGAYKNIPLAQKK